MDAAFWWALATAGLVGVVAGGLTSRWSEKRHRTPADDAERAVIRALWKLAKHVPARRLLHDPVTGRYVGIDRHHGFLELIVSDINFTDPQASDILDVVVTAYGLGGAWRPMPPPILRRYAPIHDDNAPHRTWRESGGVLRFNDRTGAMNASPVELADLHVMLGRAIAAGEGR